MLLIALLMGCDIPAGAPTCVTVRGDFQGRPFVVFVDEQVEAGGVDAVDVCVREGSTVRLAEIPPSEFIP